MITGRIGRHEVLLPIYQNYSVTKFEKEIRHWLYVFMKKKKKKFPLQNAQQLCRHMTHTVHLHRHDMLTVL